MLKIILVRLDKRYVIHLKNRHFDTTTNFFLITQYKFPSNY